MKMNALRVLGILWGMSLPSVAAAQTVGRFAAVQGKVVLERGGRGAWARVGAEIALGDYIRTPPDGRAKILFDDGTVLNLGDNTRLRLTRFVYDPSGDRVGVLDLLRGAIRAWVTRLRSRGSRFDVRTPTAVAGVRGTDWALRQIEEGTQVVVFHGEVVVRSSDAAIPGECVAAAGMSCELRRGQAVSPAQVADPSLAGAFREATRVSARIRRDNRRIASVLLGRLSRMPSAAVRWARPGRLGRRAQRREAPYRGLPDRQLPGEAAARSDTILPSRLVPLRVLGRIGGRF